MEESGVALISMGSLTAARMDEDGREMATSLACKRSTGVVDGPIASSEAPSYKKSWSSIENLLATQSS